MLEISIKSEPVHNAIDVFGELNQELKCFTRRADTGLWEAFRTEYGLKKGYYRWACRLQRRTNVHVITAIDYKIGLDKSVARPDKQTSEKGDKRKQRKAVRIVRGRKRGRLANHYFKARGRVHSRNDGFFLREEQSVYDFLSSVTDKNCDRWANG